MTWTAPAVRAGAEPAPERLTLVDTFIGACAVFLLIIYSQAWIVPLVGETVDAAAGGIVRALYFPAYVAGLIILALNFGGLMKVLVRQPFLIVLMLLAVGSLLWSINPGETMRRIVALVFTTLGGVALAVRYRWAQLAEVMAIAFGILVVLCFLVGAGLPSMGRMTELFPGAWRGLWPEKNALGNNMALFIPVFMAAAVLNPRRARVWWGIMVLAIVVLILSTSKTSLMATLLGLAGAVFIMLVRRGPAMGVAMTYIAVVGIALIAAVFLVASDFVFGLLGKDATFTGRTEIWAAVMIEVHKHPILGHGYGTVWTEETRWGPLAWIIKHAGFRPQHAHSSWMEQLLWLGWTGLFAWIAFYAQTVITALVAIFRDKGAYVAFPFLLTYSLISITESITMTYNDLRWVMFVAVACKLSFPDRLQAGGKRSNRD